MNIEKALNKIKAKAISIHKTEIKCINVVVSIDSLQKAIEHLDSLPNIHVKKIFVHSMYDFKKNNIYAETYNIEKFNDNVLKNDNLVVYISGGNKDYDLYFYLKSKIKKQFFYLESPNVVYHLTTQPNPEFLNQNYNKIVRAHELLKDNTSKEIFLRVLKSRIEGEMGYLVMSDYGEYNHPNTAATYGDICIDGGVSRDVHVTEQLIKRIRNKGFVYSFEPEPTEYKHASNNLKDYKNIKIFNLGLWNCKDKLHISSSATGASSLIYGEKGETCDLIVLDDFVDEHNIEKVDFIKLDIEGAEQQALIGMEKTLIKNKPRLAISVYHCQNDLFEIILFINSLNLDYKFYMGHHSIFGHETDLYAAVNSLNIFQKFYNYINFSLNPLIFFINKCIRVIKLFKSLY